MEFDYADLINQNEFYLDHYWHAHLPEKVRRASPKKMRNTKLYRLIQLIQ